METSDNLNCRGMWNTINKSTLFQEVMGLFMLQYTPLHSSPGAQTNKALKVIMCYCCWLEAKAVMYNGCDVKHDHSVKGHESH